MFVYEGGREERGEERQEKGREEKIQPVILSPAGGKERRKAVGQVVGKGRQERERSRVVMGDVRVGEEAGGRGQKGEGRDKEGWQVVVEGEKGRQGQAGRW